MFVLTVDQIDSQHDTDRVAAAIDELDSQLGAQLLSSPERTAGDEFQLATTVAGAALAATLHVLRDGNWSAGLGIGRIDHPTGESVRAMAGSAFVNARDAVETAKRREHRFALIADRPDAGANLDVFFRLLLAVRSRRTSEGWELFDILEAHEDLTLTAAAQQLGISVQAASQRARTAELRLDRDARHALESNLTSLSERIAR